MMLQLLDWHHIYHAHATMWIVDDCVCGEETIDRCQTESPRATNDRDHSRKN